MPELVTNERALRETLAAERQRGQRIGLIPTMGALHEGHLSLVRRARQSCDYIVVSIFVNPSQFDSGTDLAAYPRILESDLLMLNGLADLVFSPDENEIYPPGFSTYVTAPDVAKRWEGECRAGHFQGVVTIVLKLFTLIQPQAAFFGEKDYQQLQVIRQMARDLNVPVEVFGCPLIREQNGLAMSSRNRNMSDSESRRALSLFQSLEQAQQQVRMGNRNSESLMASIVKTLEEAPVDRIQYVAIVDPESLEPIDTLQSSAQVLIAVQIGATRLIDNTRIELPAATGCRSDDISAEES